MFHCPDAIRHDHLITDQTRRLEGSVGADSTGLSVPRRAKHETVTTKIKDMKAGQAGIHPVNDMERSGLGNRKAGDIYIMDLSVGDVDESRNVYRQGRERMQPDRGLGAADARPWKEGKAGIDRGRVEGVDRALLNETPAFSRVQVSGHMDRMPRKVGMYAPVPAVVGVGERVSCYNATDSHVMESVRLDQRTCHDVVETGTVGELGGRHASVLFAAGERFYPAVAVITANQPLRYMPRKMIHGLGEYGLSRCVAGCRSEGNERSDSVGAGSNSGR